MKKYIKTFESFRNEPVNEELLGGLLDFFKNLWGKATEELKKMGEKPTPEQLDQWVEKNIFNPSSNTYLFKSVLETFNKKPEANDQECLEFAGSILNPQGEVLGTQGLQPLYDDLLKSFGKNLAPLETIKYYLQTARNRAIKDYKYGGGPELKIGDDAKIDPNALKMELSDTSHLPELKKLLKDTGEDKKKKKEVTSNWVSKNLILRLLKYIQEIKPEDVKKYLDSKGIKQSEGIGEIKEGDTVVYKRGKFINAEWDKLTEDDKKKTDEGPMKDLQNKEMIGIKKVSAVNGEEVSFEGADFKKTKDEILMKVDGEKAEGQDDLVNTLKDIKTKNPEAIKKMDGIAKLYADPEANKDKIAEIEKQLGGNEGT